MVRKSHHAILAFAFFFFLTGALTAYARCLENSGSRLHHSEIETVESHESVSHTESLHCPDALKAYATRQRTNVHPQKPSMVKELSNYPAARSLKPADHPFPPRISIGPSSSLWPYRLIPLYKFNDVYRI
jgi:hypothetical protein